MLRPLLYLCILMALTGNPHADESIVFIVYSSKKYYYRFQDQFNSNNPKLKMFTSVNVYNHFSQEQAFPVFSNQLTDCSLDLSYVSTSAGAARADTCTVIGPTVIDFKSQLNNVTDRCVYSVMKNSSNGFEVLANFQERRRRDVSFLDSVTLLMADSGVAFHLEQGGRVLMNNTVLTLNSSAQEFHGVKLFKDQTGVTAQFTITEQTFSVFFDGYRAQIHTEAPVDLSLTGLCVDSSTVSNARVPQFSSSSCDTQYTDNPDSSINCTTVTESCNILKAAPFSSCNANIDPTPYINACMQTMCRYPIVDGLGCQFLWAYARACSLNSSAIQVDWEADTKCSPPEAFCQNKTCNNHEFCGNKFTGEYGCLCRAVFSQNYKESNTLDCKQNSVSLTLVGCLMEERGIDHTALHLNNQSCRGVMDQETHMVTFSFDTNNTCGAEITTNGSQTIYKNAIMTQNSSDVITYHDQVYIEFSCYQSQPEIKLVAFRIKDSSVVQHITSGDGNYTVTMRAYTDAGRTQAVDSSTQVLLNQKIWVELKTDGLDANVISVVTDSCWATSQKLPNSTPRYDLVSNGCANPRDQMVQVQKNGMGTSNYFSFHVFQFSGSSGEVYLHCQLQLCLKQKKNCVPVRNRRRRYARSNFERRTPFFISMGWIH
uniref:Pancreatic secretory granule membrane major glycoprotein GP2-like n=1 Tax=Kryptolebias marmoratus TaxID=37003 RepID=A0A3Q3A6Y5_KRYMA